MTRISRLVGWFFGFYKQTNKKIKATQEYSNSYIKGKYLFFDGLKPATRTALINHLIGTQGYNSYLEIGIRDGRNINAVKCENKTGVDPAPLARCDFVMTSDKYFSNYCEGKQFDLIFIDGSHLAENTFRDIRNGLKHLSTNGAIVVHDCNPPTAFHQREEYEVIGMFPSWNGTVWKAWVKLRCEATDLNMMVVDTDWGVGIITKGNHELYKDHEEFIYSYEYLEKHRKKMLNLVTVDEFLAHYPIKQ